jgi:hypothetical protein
MCKLNFENEPGKKICDSWRQEFQKSLPPQKGPWNKSLMTFYATAHGTGTVKRTNAQASL